MARTRDPPRALHRVHSRRLHRLRCRGRQTTSHRRRELGRRSVPDSRRCGRHWISLAAGGRIRRARSQRPLAAPNPVRRCYPVVAAVLRHDRLSRRGDPRGGRHVRSVLPLTCETDGRPVRPSSDGATAGDHPQGREHHKRWIDRRNCRVWNRIARAIHPGESPGWCNSCGVRSAPITQSNPRARGRQASGA